MSEVKICDVTLRDGMQVLNRDATLSLEQRAELARSLQGSGLSYLEVGSLVHPRVVPSMRDTSELVARLQPLPEQQLAILVPNARYYRKMAKVSNIDTVAVFVSASEAYSQLNLHRTVEQGLNAAREVARLARQDGYRVRAYVSYSFREKGPDSSAMPPETIVRLSEQLLEAGCEEISLGDTDGKASPRDVESLLVHLKPRTGLQPIAAHLHDRYGAGLANALLAHQAGIRIFDSSLGGVGGNQLLADAVGNIATEELVHLFEGLGIETGVDYEALLEAGRLLVELVRQVGDPPPPSKILAHLDN